MAEAQSTKGGADPSAAFENIDDLDCRGRRVFLRVDRYVLDSIDDAALSPVPPPDTPAGEATDAAPEARAPAAPSSSLKRLLELEARVILATDLDAEEHGPSGVASIEELAEGLSERLGVEALLPDECVGDAALRVIHALRSGQICVLPDLAGCPGEAKNDEAFARALAGYADAYVGDAFASSHRQSATLSRLPRLAPRRALGQRARQELGTLNELWSGAGARVALVLGGAALYDKIEAVRAWLPRVEQIVVGGAAALTLLAASGRAPVHVATEPARLAEARSLLARLRQLDISITLPKDLRIQTAGEKEPRVVAPASVPEGSRVLDLGPESAAQLTQELERARRVLWWGMLGHSSRGADASHRLAELCAAPERMSVVLGADTRRFVRGLPSPVMRGIDLVTTGTTAAVALLSGRRLPGIEALRIPH